MGQTTVGGVIDEDTTWSAGGNPYIVTDTLVVTLDSPKVFIGNSAIQSGGAVRVEGGDVELVAVRFERKIAGIEGELTLFDFLRFQGEFQDGCS
ncbi:MAG: hypothetical protein HRU13_03820 [Phycisphaerales bacterium]|nr:hypothetical protein [Phycisphaerales bacterium]